jgi:FeS assembly protein IscX
MKYGWNNTEDIALDLMDTYPEQDPLQVRFTDLHKWVMGLPNFDDDPGGSNEGILEAIQMAWYEEKQDLEKG